MALFMKTSLESSILFMQQEHAATLKALHEEIAKLQKKCTELSLQLALGNFGKDDASDDEASHLEQELRLTKKKYEESEKELHNRKSEIETLKQKLLMLQNEKEFESKLKTQRISSLEHELECKAKTISDLMAELHAAKLKNAECKLAAVNVPADASSLPKHLEEKHALNLLPDLTTPSSEEKTSLVTQTKPEATSLGNPSVTYILRNRTRKPVTSTNQTAASEDSLASQKTSLETSSSSPSPRARSAVTPLPPKDGVPKLRRRTNVKTPTGAEKGTGDTLTRSPLANRPLSAHRVSTPEEVIPDPAPFLAATKSPMVKPKPLTKKPKVLPPIPSRSGSQPTKISALNKIDVTANEDKSGGGLNELSRVTRNCVEKLAAVEVLSLDKTDQVEVQKHTAKYNSTTNCN